MTENNTELAAKIEPNLESGESLIWCGSTEKGATYKEQGMTLSEFLTPAVMSALVIIMLAKTVPDMEDKFSAIMSVLIFGASCLIIMVKPFLGNRGSYAVTDKRVMRVKSSGKIKQSRPYKKISDVSVFSSDRQIGFVRCKLAVSRKNKGKNNTCIYIGGISDPEYVYNLITGYRDALPADPKERQKQMLIDLINGTVSKDSSEQ